MRHLRFALLSVGLLSFASCFFSKATYRAPVAISTKSSAAVPFLPIERVSIRRCNYLILFLPLVRDINQAQEELFELSRAKGGDALIDVQIGVSDVFSVMFPPFLRMCWEVSGTAAKLRPETPQE